MKAVTTNRLEIVEFLLRAGADMNFKNKVSAHVVFVAEISLLNLFSKYSC